jgi:hypothetical protein
MVDCDYFTEWISNDQFLHHTKEEDIFVAGSVAKVALEYPGLNMSVAIENVWTHIGIQILKKQLKTAYPHMPIRVIWLYCAKNESHKRDELKVPENQMKA